MKLVLTKILLILSLGNFAATAAAEDRENLVFSNIDDMRINLVLEKDVTYVFQAWASWCASCSKAIKKVDDVVASLKNQKIKFITVSIDDDTVGARGYLNKNAAVFSERNLAVLRDPVAKVLRNFQLKSIPATIILKPNGRSTVLHGYPEKDRLESNIMGH